MKITGGQSSPGHAVNMEIHGPAKYIAYSMLLAFFIGLLDATGARKSYHIANRCSSEQALIC